MERGRGFLARRTAQEVLWLEKDDSGELGASAQKFSANEPYPLKASDARGSLRFSRAWNPFSKKPPTVGVSLSKTAHGRPFLAQSMSLVSVWASMRSPSVLFTLGEGLRSCHERLTISISATKAAEDMRVTLS